MGASKYIRNNERNIYKNRERVKQLLTEARNGPLIERIERPSKLYRARELGYRAKPGYVVVRVRIGKGSFRRPRATHARRPSKSGIFYNLNISKQRIAESRASRKYSNMRVLGSYFLVDDGQSSWYEVLMADSAR